MLCSCNIANIIVKKEYLACAVCHRETKEDKPRTYCYHCKKVEPIVKRFIFSSEVADSTGSLDIKIFQEDIASFINTEPEDYASQTASDRAALLELSTYQNILLKVKSEQLVGGPAHLVAKAEKNSHRRGLDQIKEQSIQSKTAYQSPWL